MISIALLILVLESLARTKSAVATNITQRQAWEDVVACPGALALDLRNKLSLCHINTNHFFFIIMEDTKYSFLNYQTLRASEGIPAAHLYSGKMSCTA